MKSILVIGNGMVGYKFCEKFVAKEGSESFKITVFGEEPRPAYDRVHLSAFFGNADAKALEMAPRALDGGGGERKQGPAGIGMGVERIAGEHMVRAGTKVDV